MKKVSKKPTFPSKVKYVVPNVEDCILVIKVGTEERPAGSEDLAAIAAVLNKVKGEPSLSIVTHHAIDFVAIPRGMLSGVVVRSH